MRSSSKFVANNRSTLYDIDQIEPADNASYLEGRDDREQYYAKACQVIQ